MHQFEKALLKLIAGYSVWIFVFAMVQQLRWQFGQLVLGLTFSTSIVAVYAVAITLGTYYGSFSSAIASVFLPRATQMVTANATPKELTDIFIVFIEDIINSLLDINNSENALIIISKRINYWKKLFGKFSTNLLTPQQQRGLFGELYFLNKLLLEKNNK
mgnify:CR=1 FL=1